MVNRSQHLDPQILALGHSLTGIVPARFCQRARFADISVSKNMDDTTNLTDPDNLPILPPFEPSLPIHRSPAGEKRLVKDLGAHLRQIAALKVGSATIRTPEKIAAIIERLCSGETLLSITMDPMMPGHSTLYDWIDADPELDAAVQRAREIGAHIMFDAKTDVAMGGALSTGDRQRDELLIKVLDQAATKRNRAAFQDRVAVDATHSIAPVVLPAIALPAIDEGRFTEVDDTQASDDDKKDD